MQTRYVHIADITHVIFIKNDTFYQIIDSNLI